MKTFKLGDFVQYSKAYREKFNLSINRRGFVSYVAPMNAFVTVSDTKGRILYSVITSVLEPAIPTASETSQYFHRD